MQHETQTAETESRALLVNDIHALVSQLNEKMKAAADCGLVVECQAATVLDLRCKALGYRFISVRILAEVR